jgi:predicted nucleotidyltransferase
MINADILDIKDKIVAAVDCEKVFLFGSYAYGTPRADSDYDFFVVLDDNAEHPILAMQKIYRNLDDTKMIPVDVLAERKSRFEAKSKLPTMERKIAAEGVLLYDRA